MIHIRKISEFLNESISEVNTKPKFFKSTHYRLPTTEELKDINSFNLSSEDIINGFYYNMVGRGVLSQKNKDLIIDGIQLLCDLYNENIEYKKALADAKALKSRFL